MSVILSPKDKIKNYVTKIALRIYPMSGDQIGGIGLVYDDGHRVQWSNSNFTYYSGWSMNPFASSYERGLSKLNTQWIDVPNGFDTMDLYYQGVALNGVVTYKNGKKVAQHIYPENLTFYSRSRRHIVRQSVKKGLNISTITLNIHDNGRLPQIADVYGVDDPKMDKIDGGWSDWGIWSKWTGSDGKSCGKDRVRTSIRQCNNPVPSYDGKSCIGESSRQERSDIDCPIDGIWSSWNEPECINGIKRFERTCEGPYFGGKDCEGESIIEEECPVHGGWGEWSEFGDCQGIGGKNYMIRSRNCDNPAPINGGNDCVGDNIEIRGCEKSDRIKDQLVDIVDEMNIKSDNNWVILFIFILIIYIVFMIVNTSKLSKPISTTAIYT